MRLDPRGVVLLACAGLVGCGARPAGAPSAPALEATPAAPIERFSTAALAPTGLPGMGPYRLLVLAGPEVDELEVIGLAYAATFAGWRVTFAGPKGAPLRGGRGIALPLDKTFDAIEATAYDALFAPSGAPTDSAARALVAAFADGPAVPRVLAMTNDALTRLRDLPALANLPAATPDEGVRLEGGRLVAARAGDLPALVHALESYARVHWPRTGARP